MTSNELAVAARAAGAEIEAPSPHVDMLLVFVDNSTGAIGWAATVPPEQARVLMAGLLAEILTTGEN